MTRAPTSMALPIPKVHYVRSDNSHGRWRIMGSVSIENIFDALGASEDLPYATRFYRYRDAQSRYGTHGIGRMNATVFVTHTVRVFGVPNLFVSDGSVFSTSMTANPTLTIVALAIRQAEYIGKQMTAKTI